MRDDLRPRPRLWRRDSSRLPPPRVLIKLALALFLAVLGMWWVYQRFLKSDEDKIRDLIHSAAQAARERTPSGITAILADDFVFHGLGEFDRDTCHKLLIWRLNEFRRIDVALAPEPIPVTVEKDGVTARAEFSARVVGKWTEDSEWKEVYPQASVMRLTTVFKSGEKGWKLRELWIKRE
jgi:hypothetical protein